MNQLPHRPPHLALRTRTQGPRIEATMTASVPKPGKLLFAACEYCYGDFLGGTNGQNTKS
jgi:hypothetical protein